MAADSPATINRYQNEQKEHHWNVVASNGKIISRSSEGYERSADREHSVKLTLSALMKDYGVPGLRALGFEPVNTAPKLRLQRHITRAGAIIGSLEGLRTVPDIPSDVRTAIETAILHLHDLQGELSEQEEGL